MLSARRKLIIGIAAVAVTGAAVTTGIAVASADNPADWALSPHQVAQARQALMLAASQTNPSAGAGTQGRVTGAWPANISEGSAFGTDRAAANIAMGEPRGVSGAETQHRVVCAEAHGHFSTANLPHPPGAVAQTYSYAVICFDPTTGDVTDSGYDNKSVTASFTNKTNLDVTSAITQTAN